MAKLFAGYDIFIRPGAATPPFDMVLRNPVSIAGVKLEHGMAGSMLHAAITVAGCPAVAVPYGFDQYGGPIGLQIAAPQGREDAALHAAALFKADTGLRRLLPIGLSPGTVPPPKAVSEPASGLMTDLQTSICCAPYGHGKTKTSRLFRERQIIFRRKSSR